MYIESFPSSIQAQNLYTCFPLEKGLLLAQQALSFLCTYDQLYEIALDLKLPAAQDRKRKSKDIFIEQILGFVHYLRSIEESPIAMKCIHQLQQRMKRKTTDKRNDWQRLLGPWPKEVAVNDTDIFTMDALDEIPSNEVFSYRDTHGSVYAFLAPEIHYEVITNGPKNPYTREDIPTEDIERLLQIMEQLPHKRLPRPEETWTSAEQAFEYVLGVYERVHGIFVCADWILRFKRTQILHIFFRFHETTRQPSQYMNMDTLEECSSRGHDIYHAQYALALEMLRLAEEKDDPYQLYFICVMFFCMAECSVHFRKHLPPWIYLGAAS